MDSSVPATQESQPCEIIQPATSLPNPPQPAPEFTVYKQPVDVTPLSLREDYDAKDYEPAVDHAQAHQAALQRSTQNRRLLSDAELAAQQQAKQERIAAIRTCTVRVRLPDQMMIDMQITQDDTATTLYTKVRSWLANESQSFELRHTGPKGLPVALDETNAQKKLIKDCAFKGRVLVTLVWNRAVPTAIRHAPVLKDNLRGQAVEITLPKVDDEQDADKSGEKATKDQKMAQGSSSKKGDVEARMKKLLGFGKKK